MINVVARRLKPTGGVKVDHASANRELREELEGKARNSSNAEDKTMDAIDDADLVDVLGEIEGLVEQEEVTGDGDVNAQLEAALGEALDPTEEQQAEEDGTAAQEAEPAEPEDATAAAADEADVVERDNAAEAIADPQPQADDETPAASADDDVDDVLGEIAAALEAQGGVLAGEDAAADVNTNANTKADAAESPADEPPGTAAEAGVGDEAPAPTQTDANAVETEAKPVPGLSAKTATTKPGITVPKTSAVAVAPAVGRKGLLPPVRKAVTVAPTKAAAAPLTGATAGSKPAAGGVAVSAKPAAKAAATGAAATVKPAVIGKAAAAAPAVAPKPGAAAKPVATAAAAKPAAAGGAKPVAPAATKAADGAPSRVGAVKPAAAASNTKPATISAAKPAAAAAAAKPVVAGAAKPAAVPAAKPKALAAPKVIQARLVPDDDAEDDDAAAVEEAKTAAAPAPAKGAKKVSAPSKGEAGVAGKKGAAAGGAAAKARVVTVGAKASAAYELFKVEHKQQLIDEGMEAAEAAEQTVKDWAALSAEEKAEYEARAKEQARNDNDKPAPTQLKAQQAKAPKAPKAAPAEAGPKYYTNGYMLFLEERRPEIVGAHPEASFTDVGKLLGAEWRGLGKDDQEEYNKRAKALNAESGAQPKPRKSKKKDEAAEGDGKKQSGKAAGGSKKAAPAKGSGRGHKRSAGGADGDDPDGLMNLAVAAAEGMEIDGDHDDEMADVGGGDVGAPGRGGKRPSGSSSRKRSSSARGGGSKKRRRSDEADKAEADEGEAVAAEESDESDREDVDWEAHPAEAILAKTSDGRYLVKRASLGLDEYGIVNGRAVKRQRLNMGSDAAAGAGDSEASLPVSIEMVDEFEAFERSFWASIQDRSDGGDLDLDDLGENSPLELCYYLGKLRENRMALHPASITRRDKDTMIRVPALRLSMAVQRVLMLERQRADNLAARLAEAETRLAQYEGQGEAEEGVVEEAEA
ncbi:hypothetical protein VOLCADRAFT_115930 [Volvox carteri f. nagariensis]|uniref:HMG box domain-containing protein n=1 Tax=Volvox carteri f. nagariensis TaxID=3068 RepID=D8TIZ8_VOLCA|nr:uncharacterized protein VOLCADRAFT_115930 [Volvox carteri f. nagariensis]EFJ52287.1 hypothetical protein VOLCADRAFT_115930 [Volvox carteri f. nagariensis]|eukprot:XP_002946360.1 hypothetical protein VOLCADRAFT_115930 [Volvox carteri f. nagariensis]